MLVLSGVTVREISSRLETAQCGTNTRGVAGGDRFLGLRTPRVGKVLAPDPTPESADRVGFPTVVGRRGPAVRFTLLLWRRVRTL
jgi:hypothetical protein